MSRSKDPIEIDRKNRELRHAVAEAKARLKRESQANLDRQAIQDASYNPPSELASHKAGLLALRGLAAMSALWTLSSLWVLATSGQEHFFAFVRFLGLIIRPHVVAVLQGSLLFVGYFTWKARVNLTLRNDVTSSSALPDSEKQTRLLRTELAGRLLEVAYWLLCVLFVSFAFSLVGWEAIVTHLNGGSAPIAFFLGLGSALRFAIWFFF